MGCLKRQTEVASILSMPSRHSTCSSLSLKPQSVCHRRSVLALSHQSWDSILAEKDNDREWVPNADQTSVVPAVVTVEQIESWRRLLNEADALLTGEKLLPHWRLRGVKASTCSERFWSPSFLIWCCGCRGGSVALVAGNPELRLNASFSIRCIAMVIRL